MISLRQRIVLTVVPLLVLLLLIGGSGAVLLLQLGRRSDAILRENYDSVQAMVRLSDALERIDSSFQFALAGQEAEARAMYRDNWKRYREQLSIEESNITIYPEEPRLVAQLQDLTIRYRKQGDRFYDRPRGDAARRTDYFGTKELPGLLKTFREAKSIAATIHDLNENQMKATSSATQRTARLSIVGFIVGLIVAVGLAALAAVWLQRTVLGPISAVTEAAQTIGGGQLHLSVPVLGTDEIGKLAEAFNMMTRKLRAYRQTNTEKLLRARQTSQATIDSFSDPVIIIDLLGRVEFANGAARRVLGVTAPAEGQAPVSWQPPETLHLPLAEALQQQRPYLTETFDQAVTFRLGGDDHAYLPQIHPIRSTEGETLGAAIVLNDITRFRILDRLKSDWVATVSHELKTPLTSVRLAVHVLLEEVVGPLEPKQVELLVEARENTERLLKLIEHLLALARLEDDREQLQFQLVEPVALLRAAVEEAGARAEDRRVQLVIEDEPDLPPVRVDPGRLGQSLNNLVDNALRYTEPGGKVTLSATRGENSVQLAVADTGVGIPPEYLPHVFDRFFRVPGHPQSPGTGLGLAIVREVVNAHGGDVTCDSQPGKGTTFTITLPSKPEAT